LYGPNEYRISKLRPGEVDIHQTTQNGVHKIVVLSYFGVRVSNFIYVKMMQENRQQPSDPEGGSQLGKVLAHFSHFEMF
jgi:hypothetical protein